MASAMGLHVRVPASALSKFVELLWCSEGYRPQHRKERILPSGAMQLIVDMREASLGSGGALFAGVHLRSFVLDTAQQEALVGAFFRPGGAFPFLGVPAHELRNAHAPLDALWSRRDASKLRDALLEARTPDARLRLMERALTARLVRSRESHPAVRFAVGRLEVLPTVRVSDLAGDLNLSHRRFIELFRAEVGVTPKAFARIRRFQSVLRRVLAGQPTSWTDVALSCGYFDQAHFNHDFRAFSGIHPTAYVAALGEHVNHVPLD